jgi:catalase
VIGGTEDSQPLLDAAGVVPDEGVLATGDAKAFLTAAANGRVWDREPSVRTTY